MNEPNQMNPVIMGLPSGMPEIGKIKIGRKGAKAQGRDFRLPQKLDHFLITTVERDENDDFKLDAQLMNALMNDQGKDKITEIPIRLVFDDPWLNFRSRFVAYRGRTRWCSGDGQTALRLRADGKGYEPCPEACPCFRAAPDYAGEDGKGAGKCKVTGCLSVIIDGAQVVGGVWKFRTTSYNTVQGIQSNLMFFAALTGGILRGLPLTMRVVPKSATIPGSGATTKVYIVTLEYRGQISDLLKTGQKIALENAHNKLLLEHIEERARKIIDVDTEIIPDDDDHVDEFYPEAAAGPAPALVEPGAAADSPAPETAPTTEAPRRGRPRKTEAAVANPEPTPESAAEPAPQPVAAPVIQPPAGALPVEDLFGE